MYWPTVEHFFQAAKFLESAPHHAEAIRQAATPGGAKRMGRSRAYPILKNWDDERVHVMRRAVQNKFTTHEQLRRDLLATGDELLIEKTGNSFWGGGNHDQGQNMLGCLLMELRESLRQSLPDGQALPHESNAPPITSP